MKRMTLSLVLLLAVLLLVPMTVSQAASGSDFTDQPELARKIDALLQGEEPIFSNTEEKYAVGSSLDPGFTYMWQGETYSGTRSYAYAQAAYYYLFGDVPVWGDQGLSSRFICSSTIAGVRRMGRLSSAMFRNTGVGPGAYLRTTDRATGDFSDNGCSMIILTYDAETVTYLHGDADGNGLIAITTSSWRDFNNEQLAGVGRCVAHMVQPNQTAWTKSSIQKPVTLEFRDVSWPATYKISLLDSWFPVSGTLFTGDDASLETVQSVIVASDGMIVCDTGLVTITGNTFNIKTLDQLTKFKWIFEDGQYYWIFTATDSAGRDLRMVMPFTAVSSGSTKLGVRSLAYPSSDAAPEFPAWENEWVYKILTPYGLNLRSMAGASGEVKTALQESDLFTVYKKVHADDYTWGYSVSASGLSGWCVVDNEWTQLISSRLSSSDGETAQPDGALSGDANGDGRLDREDLRLMIRYYADHTLQIQLQNCDPDQDGTPCTLEDIMLIVDALMTQT